MQRKHNVKIEEHERRIAALEVAIIAMQRAFKKNNLADRVAKLEAAIAKP